MPAAQEPGAESAAKEMGHGWRARRERVEAGAPGAANAFQYPTRTVKMVLAPSRWRAFSRNHQYHPRKPLCDVGLAGRSVSNQP